MLNLRCPESNNGQKSFLVCLYICKKAVKKKCSVYKERFEEILKQPIDQKYIDKYGAPDYCKPPEPRKRKIRSDLGKKRKSS